ncbi:MAG TPA: enoyl-CoA hydratase/isomerase family protein, partial [Mycobacterium sp.]|nr:enoyl-CoA hydratase/isomerase family protein [Mycobacterium sp.]
GFLNRVVSSDDLDAEVEDLVAQLLTKSALTLSSTKRNTNAVTAGMVAPARSWSDADALVTALHDPESRRAATAYLDRVRRR